MESLEDRDLRAMLRAWKAPVAPPGLHPPGRRNTGRWWRWLLTGTIRVPVPVGIVALVLLAAWIASQAPGQPVAAPPPAPVTLADFQPVPVLEPIVVGEP